MSECKYPVSLSDVAHAHKLPPSALRKSFSRFLEVMPDAEDHAELVEETTRGGFGGRCLTYRVGCVLCNRPMPCYALPAQSPDWVRAWRLASTKAIVRHASRFDVWRFFWRSS